MIESEWITWDRCPRCGELAAVGWSDAGRWVDPVEFDCPRGCRLPSCELVKTFPSRSGSGRPERAVHVE